MNFNPRSRVGNDVSFVLLSDICGNFNPRSRVGNDQSDELRQNVSDISIHVPAWGTTAINADTVANMQFQSTFPRGERPMSQVDLRYSENFNPRSRVGNDSDGVTVTYPSGNFNPRSRVGNDQVQIRRGYFAE